MNLTQTISVLFLGDVIGKPGRLALTRYVSQLTHKPDLIIANVENLAHGYGVTEKNLEELRQAGVQCFTGGNHTFDRKEIFQFIEREPCLLRPANYPKGTPGKGWCLVDLPMSKVAVLNLQGRIFMEPLDSPFMVADELLPQIARQTNLIIVDMHAEATAEKVALGWYLDGRVSCLVGSHTHVQTADERVLPLGTAYLTDLGCCGPADGVIGMERQGVLRRLIKQLPTRLEVASGPAMVNGALITLDVRSGKANTIRRVHWHDEIGSDSTEKQGG